jgi:glycosyltransferase involved in cell wall biosynthesis
VSGQRVALAVTVLDECSTIDALFESVAAQTRPPDEIVVVDGGSTDGTFERAQAWRTRLPLSVVRDAGASIARGRNLAIAAASADLVAVTDAGVTLDATWLERLLARLGPEVDVVAGFFVPDPRTAFECALGATTLPDRSDVRADSFLPSSRSILFRRRAWEAVDGYPEWLDYCEDLVFDLALKRQGARFSFAPDAIAHFRPRSSWGAHFRQYFRYARGDGKADLWRTRHAVRYATYIGAAVLALIAGRGGRSLWAVVPLVFGALAYVRRPYGRLASRLTDLAPHEAGYALALVPPIRAVGDVAKMLGYPVGVLWRMRNGC